jgi:hypothetical protein
MPSFFHPGTTPLPRTGLLSGLAIEGRALTVRLLAYFCGLGMLAVIATDLYQRQSEAALQEPAPAAASRAPADWTAASRPHPAFAVKSNDFSDKSETYRIARHREGGRKDTLSWRTEAASRPVAEIEIYRAGGEVSIFRPAAADLARRFGLDPGAEPQPAGVVATKFGTVPLWSLPGAGPSCLGFARAFEAPRLRISGWSCQAASRAAQRRLIGCTLDRLVLLSAGSDPQIAELFARAELRRADCPAADAPTDWVSAADTPPLRGRL